MNLSPLRDWYKAHAPDVQLDSTHWSGALREHTLDELTLAVEYIDLPPGNVPTPALVNSLIAEVQQAKHDVERRAASDRGIEQFRRDRADGFRRFRSAS